MEYRQKVIVNLPHLISTVSLPPRLAKTLELVIDSDISGVSTVELNQRGCLNPSKSISELRKQGAVIFTELRSVEDHGGEIHQRVGHYIYCGWRMGSTRSATEGSV